MIRKLRTWPARVSLDAFPAAAPPPCFHFAESMAVNEEISVDLEGSGGALSSDAGARYQLRFRENALAEFHFGAALLHFNHTSGDHLARFVLGDVFVHAGRLELLHANLNAALSAVHFEDHGSNRLAHRKHFTRDDSAASRR